MSCRASTQLHPLRKQRFLWMCKLHRWLQSFNKTHTGIKNAEPHRDPAPPFTAFCDTLVFPALSRDLLLRLSKALVILTASDLFKQQEVVPHLCAGRQRKASDLFKQQEEVPHLRAGRQWGKHAGRQMATGSRPTRRRRWGRLCGFPWRVRCHRRERCRRLRFSL